MPPTEYLTTGDVYLRAMEPDDIDLLYSVENDPNIFESGISNVPYSRYLLREFILNSTGDIYTDKQVRMMFCHDETTLGIVDLIDFNPHQLRAEVGITTLRSYRRHGYGTQALRLLAEYAARTLHLHHLYAYIDFDNEASLRLFRKAGYQQTATLKGWLYDGKKHHDAAFMQLFL